MKLYKIFIKTAILLLFISTSSLMAAIVGSKHDIQVDSEEEEELCVYCHTPNNAKVLFEGLPSWNKSGGNTVVVSFTMYNSTANEDNTNVNSQTMVCLGCHDGVSAVNTVPNIVTHSEEISVSATGMATGDMGNHPVSVRYTAGIAGLRPTGTSLSMSTGMEWSGGATTISDILRGPNKDRIECGSCHDPHMGENPTFLRVSHNASNLCLGCHNK